MFSFLEFSLQEHDKVIVLYYYVPREKKTNSISFHTNEKKC